MGLRRWNDAGGRVQRIALAGAGRGPFEADLAARDLELAACDADRLREDAVAGARLRPGGRQAHGVGEGVGPSPGPGGHLADLQRAKGRVGDAGVQVDHVITEDVGSVVAHPTGRLGLDGGGVVELMEQAERQLRETEIA